MNYVGWAVLGMAGYSATTLFTKLAVKAGGLSTFQILAIAVTIVFVSVWTLVATQGGFVPAAWRGAGIGAIGFALATGVVLAIAVSSLFKGLSLGPASVVVPIYGMFILGGSILGMLFLGEPLTLKKAAGLLLAVIGVVLIAG